MKKEIIQNYKLNNFLKCVTFWSVGRKRRRKALICVLPNTHASSVLVLKTLTHGVEGTPSILHQAPDIVIKSSHRYILCCPSPFSFVLISNSPGLFVNKLCLLRLVSNYPQWRLVFSEHKWNRIIHHSTLHLESMESLIRVYKIRSGNHYTYKLQ